MKKIENFTDYEWEKLASYFSEEKKELTDLINQFRVEDNLNTELYWRELKKMNSEKDINVDNAWAKVSDRLNESNLEQINVPSRTKFIRNTMIRAAAVALIFIALGSSAIYLNNSGLLSKKIIVTTDNDQKNLQVALPDGSNIYLNRNTEITYHANLGKYSRKVKLTGEAFFEISPDAAKPFYIDAGKVRVSVVGTSFNVITKNAVSEVEVFVKTGKVILSDNSTSKSLIIDPGFVGTIDSKTLVKTINHNPNYMSWKTGLLEYDGQKLDVVFNDLKRVYNMDIIADDPEILENTWTSPINNQTQETIIRLICTSFNLSYSKNGNVYHLVKK